MTPPSPAQQEHLARSKAYQSVESTVQNAASPQLMVSDDETLLAITAPWDRVHAAR
jgi:hypothetical protein